MPADLEVEAANLAIAASAKTVTSGASVIYQGLNPPYHLWHRQFPLLQEAALEASRSHGARYVSIENLYMYDPGAPINEDAPFRPCSKKRTLRALMAEQIAIANTVR